jgi:hypothetical protein
VNPLAAAALAAGELICEFNDGYRKSLLAEIAGDTPRVELVLVYEALKEDSAEVLSSRRPGRRPVKVRAAGGQLHLIEQDGPSVRVTTLTGCTRTKLSEDGTEICTRFEARHSWTFDTAAPLEPAAAAARLPSGAATGNCEPWKIE